MPPDNHLASAASGPSPTGLASLPTDLLVLITDYLSLASAKTFAQVNRALYQSSRYRTLRHVSINLKVNDFEPTQLWLRKLVEEAQTPAIRTLTVQDVKYDYHRGGYRIDQDSRTDEMDHLERITSLCRALPSMTGLHLLDWKGENIPRSVLKATATLPKVKLSAHLDVQSQRQLRSVNASSDGLLDRLHYSANLHSLDIQVQYIKANECSAFMRSLKSVLLTCTNLRKLKLNVYMPSGGCVIYGIPEVYHGLRFTGDEKPPALEELDLIAYPFGSQWHDRGQPSSIDCPADIDEINRWAERFDWSNLKKLSLLAYPEELLVLLCPRLTALKEFTYYGTLDDPTRLSSIPSSLSSIAFTPDRDFDIDLQRHGATLRKLTLHGEEDYSRRKWSFQSPDMPFLRLAQSTCMRLEEMEIDVCRSNGDWPYDVLNILAGFKVLRKLTLWFPLPTHTGVHPLTDGLDDIDGFPDKPFVTFSSSTELFRYLRASGSKVEEFIVRSGAPQQTPVGYVSEEAFWPAENSTTFRVAVPERD